MDPTTVQTAAEPLARTVRIQIITPPGALTRDAQKQLVKDATGIMADICGDPSLAKRTWVHLASTIGTLTMCSATNHPCSSLTHAEDHAADLLVR
jgi:hypothetical protein